MKSNQKSTIDGTLIRLDSEIKDEFKSSSDCTKTVNPKFVKW